ncbi:MAG TPA: hypothetical protein VF635_03275 [Propionibacteriaceae bacterium]
MTTTTLHVKFDARAFSRALEGRDPASLAGVYADRAHVSIVTRGSGDRVPRVLQGPVEISAWLRRLCGEYSNLRVVTLLTSGADVTVIAECHRADKSISVFACTAHIQEGLVVHQYVVVS